MANDIIDITVGTITDSIEITVNPNLTTINIIQLTGNVSPVTSVNGRSGDVIGLAEKLYVDSQDLLKVDKESGKGLSSNDYTTTEKNKLANQSGINTGDQDLSTLASKIYVDNQDALKVDKIIGKGLSTNDYTTLEQTKLAGISEGAEVNVNADWNATSGDAQILNKPIIPNAQIQSDWSQIDALAFDFIKNKPIIPVIITKTSELINDGDDGNSFISLQDLPSNVVFFPTSAPSDIVGYSKMVTSITDPSYNTTAVNVSTGGITTTNQLIASLATSTNIIVGNPGVFNITTIGNIRCISGSGTASFFFRVYKRDSTGTETLVATSDNTIPVLDGGTFAEFSATAIWDDGIFLSTDRVVIKYLANRISGGSTPTYEFQFGGVTPIRTLVPIPLTVIPFVKLDDIADVSAIAPNNNEILTYELGSTLWKPKTVISALGFTPYNSTNPNNYTSNLGTVTNVSAITLGTSGTDLSSTVANSTTTPVITLNVPTSSSLNRGVLSSADWISFNSKISFDSTSSTRLANTSGTNTGDETITTIKSKLGITTLSGSNTGDQTLSGLGGEPTITAGTTSQYWRGDKSWQTFPTIPTVGTWGALNYPTWVSNTPFVKMTALGTFALDNSTYLQNNQSITLSGAVTGTGTTSIVTTLANSIVGIDKLSATGTPSVTTYLRGDNTWATVNGNALVIMNRQSASYTLVLTDSNKLIEMNVATANNLTIPLSTLVNFDIGTKLDIVQYGAGQTTIVPAIGVTIRSANNWLKLNAQYGAVTLTKIGTNEWYLWGNLNA